ncbi:hypothetical protein [uncultured Campylobacter sp.]|uniref:hypothetical protein n=1 Tax=uncultured Campylobacter sp. TaxID=218934 RepID=UPI0015AB3AD5|nr:hypothetical protein [uncultured Campylobacter sp.]
MRAPDVEQNSQCAQNKRRTASAQNTEYHAEFKTTRDTTNVDAQKPQGRHFTSAQIKSARLA